MAQRRPREETPLAARLEFAVAQKKFAWAMLYRATGERAYYANVIAHLFERSSETGVLERPTVLPPHITEEFFEMASQLNREYTCPVCLDLTTKDTFHLTSCGHILCKVCYERMKTDAAAHNPHNRPSCPICRKNI